MLGTVVIDVRENDRKLLLTFALRCTKTPLTKLPVELLAVRAPLVSRKGIKGDG